MTKWTITIILCLLTTMVTLISCDDSNCTLENKVTMGITFYGDTSRKAISIQDYVTISFAGADTVINLSNNVSSARLPLSYWHPIDTMIITVQESITEESVSISDTVFINKVNVEYIEGPDCPLKVFHAITSAHPSGSGFISEVILKDSLINYGTNENMQIYIME